MIDRVSKLVRGERFRFAGNSMIWELVEEDGGEVIVKSVTNVSEWPIVALESNT